MQKNIFGCFFNSRIKAPLDPGQIDKAFCVFYYHRVFGKRIFNAVNRGKFLPPCGQLKIHDLSVNFVVIKSVHGNPQFIHNIICNIDDVIYGSMPHRDNSFFQPFGRRSYGNSFNNNSGPAFKKTEVRHKINRKIGRLGRHIPDLWLFYFQPLYCGNLPGNSENAHPVGSVGGNFNIHYYFPSDFLGSFASKPGFGHFPHKILQG